MIISTTDTIPGYRTTEMKGIVHASLARTFSRDPEFIQCSKRIVPFIPGLGIINRDATVGYLMKKANELLWQRAQEQGANAVVAVNYKFSFIWNIAVDAYGTAMIIEKSEHEA